MKTRILTVALILGLSLSANAEITVVQEAYEVALSELRLPQNDAGTIAFKECRECNYTTRRVTVETVYKVNGNVVGLEDFRAAVARVDDKGAKAVTVIHHLERNQVTQVQVYL